MNIYLCNPLTHRGVTVQILLRHFIVYMNPCKFCQSQYWIFFNERRVKFQAFTSHTVQKVATVFRVFTRVGIKVKPYRFRDNTTCFLVKWSLRKDTQIWVVLPIGWSKFPSQRDQSEALPMWVEHVIRMDLLRARFSDIISSENHWLRR